MIQSFTPTLSPIVGWTEVSPSGGLKDATLTGCRSPDVCAFNGKIYVAWAGTDGFATLQRVYVSEYDPSSGTWTRIDPGSSTGLNFSSSASNITNPQLYVFNSKLYCTWSETVSDYHVRVKVWSGSGTSWSFVDGNATIGLNKSSTRSAYQPRLIEFNSKLYCTWVEHAQSGGNTDAQVRCRVYNGNDSSPAWTFVDGNAATGLNKSTTEPARQSVPVVSDGKLYLSWFEANGSAVYQVRVRVYNGNDASPSWTFVDGNGANGINANTANQAGDGSTIQRQRAGYVFDSKMYLLWIEASKPHMKVYNGNDGSPTWTLVDGGTSNGLIFDTSKTISDIAGFVPDSWNPHFAWYEASNGGVKPSVYNGNDSSVRRVSVDTSATLPGTAAFGSYLQMAFLETVYLVFTMTISGTLAIRIWKATV